jgi:hypothetical protein
MCKRNARMPPTKFILRMSLPWRPISFISELEFYQFVGRAAHSFVGLCHILGRMYKTLLDCCVECVTILWFITCCSLSLSSRILSDKCWQTNGTFSTVLTHWLCIPVCRVWGEGGSRHYNWTSEFCFIRATVSVLSDSGTGYLKKPFFLHLLWRNSVSHIGVYLKRAQGFPHLFDSRMRRCVQLSTHLSFTLECDMFMAVSTPAFTPGYATAWNACMDLVLFPQFCSLLCIEIGAGIEQSV